MEKFSAVILARPKLSITLALLGLFLALGLAGGVQKKSGVESLLSPENPLMQMKSQMSNVFGNPNLVFIITPDDGAGELSNLGKLNAVVNDIEKLEDVNKVISPFSAKVPRNNPEGFEIVNLAERAPQNETELEEFKSKVNNLPSFKGQIVGLNGHSYAAIIEFHKSSSDKNIKDRIFEILSSHRVEMWSVSGLPIINAWVLEFMDSDQAFLVPSFFFFIIFILYLAFGTPRSIFIPIFNIIISIVFMVAAMAVANISLNVVTDVLPLLIAALASAYSVHFLSQYYELVRHGKLTNKVQLILLSSKKIMPTIIMAGITTILGFVASVTSAIPAVREFSIFASIGVVGVILSLSVFTPLILFFLPREESAPTEKRHNHWIERSLEKCAQFTLRFPKIIISIALSVFLLCCASLFFVSTKYSALDYFQKSERVVRDARAISSSFGGFSSFDIVISSKKTPMNSFVLKTLDAFTNNLKKDHPEDVKVTFSLAETAKEIRKAYNGDPKYYGVPDTDAELDQYIEMYDWSSKFRTDFDNFISKDGTQIRVTGKFSIIEEEGGHFHERPVQFHAALIDSWLRELRENLGDQYTVEAYGDVPLWSHVVDEVISGQIRSIILAILIIFLVTALSIKSFSIGLICMVPVTLAVLINFLFMAVTGIQLDIATSLISGMALGIGIDDTIHFTLGLRNMVRETGDMELAIKKTVLSSGKAIIYTSIALTAGFCTYFISSFRPIIHFGLLNALTLVTTTIAALIVLPALFIVFKPRFFKEDQNG